MHATYMKVYMHSYVYLLTYRFIFLYQVVANGVEDSRFWLDAFENQGKVGHATRDLILQF